MDALSDARLHYLFAAIGAKVMEELERLTVGREGVRRVGSDKVSDAFGDPPAISHFVFTIRVGCACFIAHVRNKRARP